MVPVSPLLTLTALHVLPSPLVTHLRPSSFGSCLVSEVRREERAVSRMNDTRRRTEEGTRVYRARSDRETAGSALPPTYASLGSCLPRSTSLHSLPLPLVTRSSVTRSSYRCARRLEWGKERNETASSGGEERGETEEHNGNRNDVTAHLQFFPLSLTTSPSFRSVRRTPLRGKNERGMW